MKCSSERTLLWEGLFSNFAVKLLWGPGCSHVRVPQMRWQWVSTVLHWGHTRQHWFFLQMSHIYIEIPTGLEDVLTIKHIEREMLFWLEQITHGRRKQWQSSKSVTAGFYLPDVKRKKHWRAQHLVLPHLLCGALLQFVLLLLAAQAHGKVSSLDFAPWKHVFNSVIIASSFLYFTWIHLIGSHTDSLIILLNNW